MPKLIIDRLLQGAGVLFAVSLIAFVGIYAIGDPTVLLIDPQSTQREIDLVRHNLGLDLPMWQQYVLFLKSLALGDFGRSFATHEPAMRMILDRLPATLELAFAAMFLAVVVGIPAGLVAGTHPDSRFDRTVMTASILGFSLPTFWIGLMLILLFAVTLGWLPSFGRGAIGEHFGIHSSLFTLDGLRHILMPAVNLALFPMALVARLARSGARDALRLDFVRFARAKGVSERRIVFVHVLKYIAVPIVTMIGMQFGLLIAFAIVTESVFSWPGTGKLLIEAIGRLDRPVVVAYLLVIVSIFVLLNLVTDLVYIVLDPRVRFDGAAGSE
jgi:peptide/nickel transport system permease protein